MAAAWYHTINAYPLFNPFGLDVPARSDTEGTSPPPHHHFRRGVAPLRRLSHRPCREKTGPQLQRQPVSLFSHRLALEWSSEVWVCVCVKLVSRICSKLNDGDDRRTDDAFGSSRFGQPWRGRKSSPGRGSNQTCESWKTCVGENLRQARERSENRTEGGTKQLEDHAADLISRSASAGPCDMRSSRINSAEAATAFAARNRRSIVAASVSLKDVRGPRKGGRKGPARSTGRHATSFCHPLVASVVIDVCRCCFLVMALLSLLSIPSSSAFSSSASASAPPSRAQHLRH